MVRTLVKDRMRYPGRLMADTLTLVTRCGILLILYWYVFRLQGGVVHGTSYRIAAWSMFFYFAFSSFGLRAIAGTIMRDVRSGNVEVLFNKPVSYLAYRIWWQIGYGLYPFLLAIIFGSITLAFIVGVPQTMTIGIFLPTVLLVFLGATILSLALYSIVGLLAFWIEDINPLFWMVDKAVMILGGSYLPVALFPPLVQKLSMYSPFGASQFVTYTVYDTWAANWLALMGVQFAWIIALGLMASVLFSKAREKVSVNGG